MLYWFELMNNSDSINSPKNLCVILRPQKMLACFIDPKKLLFAKILDPKNPSDPCVIKILSGVFGVLFALMYWQSTLLLSVILMYILLIVNS